jgi:hypothetical protein
MNHSKAALSILVLLVACATGGVLGCDGGDSANNSSSNGADAGADVSDDAGGESSAFLVFSRIQTPGGRTMSASFVSELAAGDVDLGDSFELSGFSRVREYDGKLYAFDGETGSVKRYTLNDDLEMVPDTLSDGETPAEFNMSGEGVTSFGAALAWVDAETAYYFDLISGQNQVIKWNPTDMVIEDTVSIPDFDKEGLSPNFKTQVTIDDKIVLPITWANFTGGDIYEKAVIAVFSAETGELEQLVEDERCMATQDSFVEDGKVYVIGDNFNGLADLASSETDLPPPCLLRWTPGESEFDQDFYVDLEETVGTGLISGGLGRGDGTMLSLTYTSSQDPSFFGLTALLDANVWQWTEIDYESGESQVFDSLEPQGVAAPGWVIDGDYVVPREDGDEGTTTLYGLDADGPTELLTVTGDVFYVAKVK